MSEYGINIPPPPPPRRSSPVKKYLPYFALYLVVVIIFSIAGGFYHTAHTILSYWSWALSLSILVGGILCYSNRVAANHPWLVLLFLLPLGIFPAAFLNNMFLGHLPMGR